MGTAQTTINAYGQPSAIAGMMTQERDALSAVSKETVNNIAFGVGVKPGTNAKEALLPTASSSVLLGINVVFKTHAPGTFGDIDQSSATTGMKPNTQLHVLREGRCFVQVDADTVIAAPNVTRAYWRFETDGGTNTLVGTFRHSDDGHVADTRKQVLFVSGVLTAADGTKVAEVAVSAENSAS